jgi:hypothetical protein
MSMTNALRSKESNTENGLSSSISLSIVPGKLDNFFTILQQGFLLKARLGMGVRKILCDQFGINQRYFDTRINTIFLDGKPVDDVDSAIVGEGSSVALSASMPGFVGAALRKGGFYAAMRSEITHVKEQQYDTSVDGLFTLKLYNLLLPEIGPLFLSSGIILDVKILRDFLKTKSSAFWTGCQTIQVNNHEVDSSYFFRPEWLDMRGLVLLRVIVTSLPA